MAKLFTDSKNPQAWKALIAAAYAGVKVDVAVLTAQSAELKQKKPLWKSPCS